MTIRCCLRGLAVLILVLAGAQMDADAAGDEPGVPDSLIVSGTVTNPQGMGVDDARMVFSLNGRPLAGGAGVKTGSNGVYEAGLTLPRGALPGGRLTVAVSHPSYESIEAARVSRVVVDRVDADGRRHLLAHLSLTLERSVSPGLWIAGAVLLAVYVFIAFELMHRTLAALVGASVLLFVSYTLGTFNPDYRILSFDQAMGAIDGNVIFLLMAMMIIVGVLKKTGVFQWTAYQAFRTARGNIHVLAALLMIVTAVTSAFLDNVTTMLLMVPVSIEIAVALRINPTAFLLPEVFASNVGGTATLIGDPPNIMIGSYAGLSFMQFVQNLAVVCLLGLAVACLYFLFWFRRDYRAARVADVPAMTARLRQEYRITDRSLLAKCGLVLALTITLFVIHGSLHMEPSIAAMAGASLLLVISGVQIVEMVEREIEWLTLVFFMMLFILVAGAVHTGLIQLIADGVRDVALGSPVLAIVMIIWASALLSAIIDNIPFTATMLPIVAYLNTSLPGIHGSVLWWALALGACLGGNGTLIGASANVVTAGLAEKAGHPISFVEFLRVALLPMLITVALSTAWLLAFGL